MTLFVDTSVWSLALRRDTVRATPELRALEAALRGDVVVATTGLILQELLQGFHGPKARDAIVERFSALALIKPDWDDHAAAADLRDACRRHGVQIGTIDALLAQLCIRYEMLLLTTDRDFTSAARCCGLRLWSAPN